VNYEGKRVIGDFPAEIINWNVVINRVDLDHRLILPHEILGRTTYFAGQ
jgi:hypothetical protein